MRALEQKEEPWEAASGAVQLHYSVVYTITILILLIVIVILIVEQNTRYYNTPLYCIAL